jgi:hypothetical protein
MKNSLKKNGIICCQGKIIRDFPAGKFSYALLIKIFHKNAHFLKEIESFLIEKFEFWYL